MLAAGGSAGHVEPALTLADSMCAADDTVEIVALGTKRGIESRLIPDRGYRMICVPAYPLPRRPDRSALTAPARIAGSIRTVISVMRSERPDVVVGFGGYVAFPAYLAARRLGIPFVVHEANARPGVADRVGSRLTPWVAANTEGVLPHAVRIGMPLRPSIRSLSALDDGQRTDARRAARQALDLDVDAPTLLVFGGSLGARRLNETMARAQEELRAAGIQVIHLAGSAGHGLPTTWPPHRVPSDPVYRSMPYLTQMDQAYAAADVVVCRAGAMTCAEVSAVGLPAIYVPLPVGNGEQELNARPVAAAGGGLIIEDAAFDIEAVRGEVIPLLLDSERSRRMGQAAKEFAVIDADERLADMVRAAAVLAGKGARR